MLIHRGTDSAGAQRISGVSRFLITIQRKEGIMIRLLAIRYSGSVRHERHANRGYPAGRRLAARPAPPARATARIPRPQCPLRRGPVAGTLERRTGGRVFQPQRPYLQRPRTLDAALAVLSKKRRKQLLDAVRYRRRRVGRPCGPLVPSPHQIRLGWQGAAARPAALRHGAHLALDNGVSQGGRGLARRARPFLRGGDDTPPG